MKIDCKLKGLPPPQIKVYSQLINLFSIRGNAYISMQTLSINQTEMNKQGSLRIAFFLSPSSKKFFLKNFVENYFIGTR